jgi:hypothetical protein
MRKLTTALATATVLLAGSLVGSAEAAPTTGVAHLPPLTKNYSPLDEVACWGLTDALAADVGDPATTRPYYRYRY